MKMGWILALMSREFNSGEGYCSMGGGVCVCGLGWCGDLCVCVCVCACEIEYLVL
jgi:hypothetical protein